jgi:hypothetical protein
MFNPTNTPAAAALFKPESALRVLTLALHLKETGDPLAAAGVAEMAVDFAAVGYCLGRYTLSTATRIRVLAEALGAPALPGDTSIDK